VAALSRTAGAPVIPGNKIRVLKNAAENYPAWFAAIKSAKNTIHFESYIIHGDDVGREFSEVLAAKAREGVKVRVIYDWWGAMEGPAVADVEEAFASMWATLGSAIPKEQVITADELAPAGPVELRVLASSPNTAGLYRFDQLVAAIAQRSIWLTDAYFMATTP